MTRPKPPGDPSRPAPGGARWCDEHGRYECTKPRSKGRGTCHGPAIEGTAACRMHAGVSSELAKAQGQAVTAWSALGGTPAVEPGRAVLSMLHMAWLRLHLYAGLLEAQLEAQGGTSADVPVDLDDVDPEHGDGPKTGGLIGHTFAPAKGGDGRVVTGEAPRALVMLEAGERDRIVRYAKTAHDMGIAEREVKLAERQGELLASVIRNILGDLDLSDEQRTRVPQVVGRHLRAAAELDAAGGAA